MSLERFKTQVLLLHSEQSTLDNLSTGFNDRYTVHCATSGSEALNTLGETQIDVIVTAQELPGMSGLEALREAKKRSPETIGILLAGNDDDGLEALVGDQEVFQIVRGGVTPESLGDLIDNATRQTRLLALAESANDTTAGVDVPVTEHIVMETSENGATIISDGTATMPALNPAKISAATSVGAGSVDVLVLTKDEDFLATVRDSARGMHNVIHANTLAQANDAISRHKIGVAVVDAAMLGDNVEKLTMHLRSTTPRLVAIVAGRRDDGEMLMDLINRGKVYRFLLKPVSPGRARLAIEASVKHHLEAPDSAFEISDAATTAPKPVPAAKPAPTAKQPERPKVEARKAPPQEPKPQPKERPKKAEAPAKKEPQKKKPATVKEPAVKAAKERSGKAKQKIEPTIGVDATPPTAADEAYPPTPIDGRLADAFGGDASSFTETVTNIVRSVTQSISPEKGKGEVKDKKPDEAKTASVAATAGDRPYAKGKFLGLGAAAVVVVAALGWWMFGGSGTPTPQVDEAPTIPSVTETAPVAEAPAPEPIEPAIDIDELLEDARSAASAGLIYAPPGENAIDLYLSAAFDAPDNEVLAAELAAVINQALSIAESALLERRSEDAVAALDSVRFADPDNARLPFLTAQLSQVQLKNFVDGARDAIRETRYEDAAAALDAARALDVDDATEIDVVADELRRALDDERVAEVLAKANARLEEGKLIAPSNDNARFYYELALSDAPDNTAARQGLAIVASKLVLRARAQIDNGDFPAADDLLADARRIDPSSEELADASAALAAARKRVAEERRLAAERAAAEKAAAERAAAEKAAAERAAAEQAARERAAAEKAAAQRAAAEKAAAEKAAAEKAVAERTAARRAAVEKAAAERLAVENLAAAPPKPAPRQTVTPAQRPSQAPAPDNATRQSVEPEPPPAMAAVAAPTPQTARAEPVQSPGQGAETTASVAGDGGGRATQKIPPMSSQPVSVSSLQRTKYVAPKYPRAAQRRALSGYVDVVFTVATDGTVRDASARASEPGDVFVSSAVKAVEQWEFEPVTENGVPVERRAAVRMMFAIE